MATMVAEAAPPVEIFSAVSNEVAAIFHTELVVVGKFDDDPAQLLVVGVGDGADEPVVGSRWKLEDALASAAVYRTGLPARLDYPRGAADPDLAAILERIRPVATVAVPIKVGGRLWGAMIISTLRRAATRRHRRAAAELSDLIATALANAEARGEVERLAEEQAALRRVAVLVAAAAVPERGLHGRHADGALGRAVDVRTRHGATIPGAAGLALPWELTVQAVCAKPIGGPHVDAEGGAATPRAPPAQLPGQLLRARRHGRYEPPGLHHGGFPG